MQICPGLGLPSDNLKMIGVTGANGKTTTSCLIAGVLAHAGRKVGLLSSLGYFDGENAEDAERDELSPDRLNQLLARMVRNGCSHAVMAVSLDAAEQLSAAGVWFDAACLTNITRVHFDYDVQPGNHRPAKIPLFERLRGEAFAVLNADDPATERYLRELDGPALTVSIDSAAEITGMPINQYPSEQTFLITAGSETFPVRTQMIGRHHIYNCLTAATVGLAYGLELAQIVPTLEAAKHVPGRLERIECGQPFSVFVDFAHTPDGLAGCLQTLNSVTKGRLICVLGADGGRNDARLSLMGRIVEQGADAAIVTSASRVAQDRTSAMQGLLSGFRHPDRAEVVPDRTAAIHRALDSARPGDCVLIAGKRYENRPAQNAAELPKDDHQVASDWLYQMAAANY
jgi:UDP-N-acetylmuramoyl-L-alanyl-D-glutamate--2,6-diaminopimelate ligase